MSLLFIGECMMELRKDVKGQVITSFAGDTYNSAVYAERFSPALNVKYLTAYGHDMFSQDMVKNWHEHGLDDSLCVSTGEAPIGIYGINTDANGERSFSYWRKNSAATKLMGLITVNTIVAGCQQVKLLYFSGISLAILSETDKTLFLDLIGELKLSGIKVAFDPNYRAAMWDSVEHAADWIKQCYQLADIALPGLDEHADLFEHKSKSDLIEFFKQFNTQELVIKCEKEGVFGLNDGQEYHQPFIPAPQQVDSTAAGDSFSGTYLASRLSGNTLPEALTHATDVARIVVQYPGAIIPKDVM